MASIDMPLEKLRAYKPRLTAKKDLRSFWNKTIADARKHPLSPQLKPFRDFYGAKIEAFDLAFSGFRGDRIKGWYLVPGSAGKKNLPAVVVYHGYTGGRGRVWDYSSWLLMGCAVAVMDTRGQGGSTGNMMGYSNPSVRGWMTQGILDKNEYYYRGVYTDAVRILDFVFSRPEVDKKRVAVTGISQGGGITIAAAGLDPRVSLAMPDIPYLCNFQRGVELSPCYPYLEIADYLRMYPEDLEKVYDTLSYFDGMNLAQGIKGRSVWSVGLWDDICPPSTVFAAYNRVSARKEIRVYPYNKHEVIASFQAEKIKCLAKQFGL